MTTEELIGNIRVIEDFPIKGIHFQDITTLLLNPECIKELSNRLYEMYKDCGITKVVGLESRGFILGGLIAERLGAGFVPARKPGKLPGPKVSKTYSLEYGTDTIEIHEGAIVPGDVVLIHDDLFATGGTMGAAWELVNQFQPAKVYLSAIIDLTACPRRYDFPEDTKVDTLLKIDVD